MAKVFSGGALDNLLKVVLSLGGDRLELQTGQAPAAFAGTLPLRLTLPAASNSMLRAVCGEMGGLHEASPPDEHGSSFAYASSDGTRFEVNIRGVLADQGAASVRVVRMGATNGAEEAGAAPAAERSEPERPPVPAAAPATRAGAGAGVASGSKLDPVLSRMIGAAIAAGASDLHLTEGTPPVFRVQGRLRAFEGPAFDVRSLLPDDARRSRVLDGHAVDFALDFEGSYRLRANVYLARQGVCAALRILPRGAPDLAELGLPEEVLALTRFRDGLVLFCGQTGSGKSSSLAALTRSLLEDAAMLCISLESPIEFDLTPRRGQSRVRQREVGSHVPSFAAGLRDALREDPDVILIGEIRDRDSAALALTAAETGHLVLSSLHCRTAASAVERIVDLFPGEQQSQIRGQLADSLRAVVSQQLLPNRRGDRRVLAAEVLTLNHAAAHLIREGKPEQLYTVMHTGKHAGMLPLERHLARLVKGGQVEHSVAKGYVRVPELFDPALRGAGG
jgi:twitching motility protein PilT